MNDESQGIFQKRVTGFVAGRVGRGCGSGQCGGGQRGGGGQNRGRGQGQGRGGAPYRGRGGYAHSAGNEHQYYQNPHPQLPQLPPTPQPQPVVQQPQGQGFGPYQGGWPSAAQPQSHSSTPSSMGEMAGFFNYPEN